MCASQCWHCIQVKGLPESLPQALFCLWLKKSGIFDKVRKVEAAGKDFFKELNDLYVSPVIAKALLAADARFRNGREEGEGSDCGRNFPGASP
jgi:hypothetical protein